MPEDADLLVCGVMLTAALCAGLLRPRATPPNTRVRRLIRLLRGAVRR